MKRAIVVVILLLTWAPETAVVAAEEAPPTIADLEARRDSKPGNFEARMKLGWAYWARARGALDERRFGAWQDDIARAMDEWLAALAIDRDRPDPHNAMAFVALYQGELDRAVKDLGNARRLDPKSGLHYANLAQAMIYRGNMTGAARFLLRARDLRADPAQLELNRALVDWYYGRIEDAAWHYGEAVRIDPRIASTFDGAEVPEPLDGFDDFARYCCASIGCGPYMKQACGNVDAEVASIELPEDIARRQLMTEMERRRRIAKIYGIRRAGDDPLASDDGDRRIEIDPVEDPDQRRTVTIQVEDEAGDESDREAPGTQEPAEEPPVGTGGFKGGPL